MATYLLVGHACAVALSVSPIGSSPLQPLAGVGFLTYRFAFSIPNRIEPSATAWLLRVTTPDLPLSVSPIGSSPLQQIYEDPASVPQPCFQYPQSDRALCNRLRAALERVRSRSFSIPNRIEPSATQGVKRNISFYVSFSIPNRIEPSATPVLRKKYSPVQSFQYPQSDRALCNSPIARRSTLYT